MTGKTLNISECVAKVMEHTGWSRQEAAQSLFDATMNGELTAYWGDKERNLGAVVTPAEEDELRRQFFGDA